MQNLLNFGINDEDMTTKWNGDKVVNTYCKENLAQKDKTQCQQENGKKCKLVHELIYFQNLFDEMNANATLHGRYNYEKKSKWIKKASGNNIFNLKNIYFIISVDNNHRACIVVYMEEKRIQYYSSLKIFGKDDFEGYFKVLI